MNTAPPDPPFATFDPENPAIWDDLGAVGTLLLPVPSATIPDPGNICIRVAPVTCNSAAGTINTANPGGMTLQLVASFGRPVVAARTPTSSPFSDPATGGIKTTFIAPNFTQVLVGGVLGPAAGSGPNTSAGWFFALGNITVRNSPVPPTPPSAHFFLTDRYEFSVGAIAGITTLGVVLTRRYGDDPEMDVGQ